MSLYSSAPYRKSQGLTLIEIMIVVMVVGVLASGIALVASRDRLPALLNEESFRLRVHVNHLRALAMNSTKPYGIIFTQGGWKLLAFTTQEDFLSWGLQTPRRQTIQWQPLTNDNYSVALPQKLHLQLQVNGAEADLYRPADEQNMPQVLISPRGEVTPFEVHFLGAGQDEDEGLRTRVTTTGQVDRFINDEWQAI